jgi:hypothetical protein
MNELLSWHDGNGSESRQKPRMDNAPNTQATSKVFSPERERERERESCKTVATTEQQLAPILVDETVGHTNVGPLWAATAIAACAHD